MTPSKTLEPLPSSQSAIQGDENDRSMTMHDREGLINKQPNKAEPGVINILHAVALHSAGWDRALVTA